MARKIAIENSRRHIKIGNAVSGIASGQYTWAIPGVMVRRCRALGLEPASQLPVLVNFGSAEIENCKFEPPATAPRPMRAIRQAIIFPGGRFVALSPCQR